MEFLGLILQDPFQQKQKHLADMYEKKSNVSMFHYAFEYLETWQKKNCVNNLQ
jgi:hypothetical protein